MSENNDRAPVYTVTVYLAPPGTLRRVGDALIPSTAGHMYYSISDGETTRSYGFSPMQTGVVGAGEIKLNEHRVYIDPAYALTLEITREQFLKLDDYGDLTYRGKNPDFNLTYNGVSNSCIDFTWAALNHAGLHARKETLHFDLATGRFERRRSHELATDFDGDVKVMDNKDDLRSIPPPFPGSRHNGEVEHPMPDRKDLKWYQPLITENHEVPASTPSLASLSAKDQRLVEHIHKALDDVPISDARMAQVICQCKLNHITDADQLRHVGVHHNQLHVLSHTPGFRFTIDLGQEPPPLQQSLQDNDALAQQLAQERQQAEQQRQQHALQMG